MLDKNKTYIGLSFSDNLISDFIEDHQQGQEFIKGNKCSHVLALIYCPDNNATWYIFEASILYGGVRKIKLSDYVLEKTKDKKDIIIFKELDLDIPSLIYYYNFIKYYPYDVKNLFYRLLDNVPLLSSRGTKNLICSKYLAMSEVGYKTCYEFNIPYDEITPAHLQKHVERLPIDLSINLLTKGNKKNV
jgi:hypothetical protein